jgi:hypothetical protein
MNLDDITAAAKVRPLTTKECKFLILTIMSDGHSHKSNVVLATCRMVIEGVASAQTAVDAHRSYTEAGKCKACEEGAKIIEKVIIND